MGRMALRLLSKCATKAVRSTGKAVYMPSRGMSLITQREVAEETIYFQKMDEELKHKMRLELEAIMASSETEKHQEVMELLGMSAECAVYFRLWMCSLRMCS